MRRQARETVFKYIYSRLFNIDEGLFDVLASDLNIDDKKFATDLLNAVDKDFDKNLQVIQDYSIGFKLDRVINVDKCALLVGLAELDNFPDTPTPVVIDEAVNICAKYSTEKSTDYVNGILSRYATEKKND
ncbi:MAG: transcription antitermination protein NusB [Clostridia bacterium]|nr:transcription antitermination protein NusB [Clostridia bacterium]